MAGELAASGAAKRIPGHWLSINELLLDADVTGFLEFPQTRTEITVGLFEQFLEPRKRERLDIRQQDTDSKASPVLQDRIESLQGLGRLLVLVGRAGHLLF